ncbi:MAG: hypothetical protein K0S75_1992 [Clostridia bacterium]|jgi:hypothetical protein|nr:hypothetical protein [Clostridia bacterium]
MKKFCALLMISAMLIGMTVAGMNVNTIAYNEVPEPKTIIFHI